jgi:hypothetical protein
LKSGSKVKISKEKLGFVKAAQNQKAFTFNSGDFRYLYQIYFFSHGKIQLEVTYNFAEFDFSNSDILHSF